MKYLSLFSGIGGFELGIQQAYEDKKTGLCERGLRASDEMGLLRHNGDSSNNNIGDGDGGRTRPLCIGYSEIDKYAIQVYNKHFNHKNYGDITKIKPEELPDFDLIVGGFPCQSFSIAGKRGGFNDTRGTLFFEIARIIKQKQPRLLLLENVKGLLSHDKGRTFTTIISTLDELGYECQWQVLNSKNHGVPQNRERVFIVGHLRGTPRPEVFPFGKSNQEPIRKTIKQGCSNTLTGRSAGGYNRRGNYIKQKSDTNKLNQINNPKHSNNRVYSSDGISPTLNTMQGGQRQPFIMPKHSYCLDANYQKGNNDLSKCRRTVVPILTLDRPKKRQDGRRFKEDGEPSFTLTAQDKHGIYDGLKIRRLTPKECERLQGFPDDWTKEGVKIINQYDCETDKYKDYKEDIAISDSQRYKMIGNAVTTNVIKEIMKKLLET